MKTPRVIIKVCLLIGVILQTLTSAAQPVTKISAGGFHSLFIKSDGSLWDMGSNANGELGDGTYIGAPNYGTNQPEKILNIGVTAVAGGNNYSLFIGNDHSLWVMGSDLYGQLGDGNNTYFTTNMPEQILSGNVTVIAGERESSGGHTLFIKNDGSLWTMGYNFDGQLGNGTLISTNRPQQILASNVTAVAAGCFHSLFIKSDGSLWAMGHDYYGELGDGIFNHRTSAHNGTNQPEQIVASGVTSITAGSYHSLFLKSDGSLWAMGRNNFGQLGDGTTNDVNLPEQVVSNNVIALAAGAYHSLFIKSDGSLWAMGSNQSGQLGDGTTNDSHYPKQIIANGVVAIAAGYVHSLFLKNDGSLWAFGANSSGQLGDGTFNNTNQPEQIVAAPPAYNKISWQLLDGGNVQLSFVGIPAASYALDYSSNLYPFNWTPLTTNFADSSGLLVFTNRPNPTTNNFWRVRSVP